MYLKYYYRGFSKERVVIKSSYGLEKITLDEAIYFVCFKVKSVLDVRPKRCLIGYYKMGDIVNKNDKYL